MRLILSLLLCMMGAAVVHAADLSGQVVTGDGYPVPGARVELDLEGRSAVTDGEGRFSFADVAVGGHRLRISPPGGEAIIRRANTGEPENLIQISTDLERLVVRANPLAGSTLEMTQPVSILTGEELRAAIEPTLGDTLARQPGVASTTFGQGAGRPVIRGLTGSRVRVLQDGIGALDASTVSDDHAVAVEPLLADSIEVVRGPGTLLYGTGTVGGVVNVIDNRIPEQPVAADGDGDIDGAVELRANSVADGWAAVARLDGGAGAFAWHADAYRRDDGDYEVPNGGLEEPGDELEGSFVENEGAAIGGTYFFGDDGFLGFAISGIDSLYGVPGHGHEEAHGEEHGEEHGDEHGEAHGEEEGEEESVSIDLEQVRFDLKGQWNRPFSAAESLRVRAAYNDYQHIELEGAEQGTRFDNEEFEGRLELALAPWGQWRSLIGLQYRDRDFSAVGEEAFVPPSQTEVGGIFALAERRLGDLRFEVGARFDDQEVRVDSLATGRDHDGFSASGGLSWAFHDRASLAFNLARVTQFPTPEQLFADGAHLATDSFEVGDPNLDEEQVTSVDLGIRITPGPFYLGASVYYYDFDDFIFQAETGLEEDGLPLRPWAQDDAEFLGAEAEAGWRQSLDRYGILDLRVWGDVVEGELDNGQNLPRITPARYGVDLDWSRNHWSVGVGVTRVTEQDDTAPAETATEAYTLVDADVAYEFIGNRLEWSVFLQGRNLGDELARAHTSFLKDQAPLPGRNFIAGVRLNF